MSTLTPQGVYGILKRFLPEQNDDFKGDYFEELTELTEFQIKTETQLSDLLERRLNELLEIDRSPIDGFHIRFYSEELGEEYVTNRLKKGFWFNYPALLRIALELEFGKTYEDYAARRDGIAEQGNR